jgi:hypothetical protein
MQGLQQPFFLFLKIVEPFLLLLNEGLAKSCGFLLHQPGFLDILSFLDLSELFSFLDSLLDLGQCLFIFSINCVYRGIEALPCGVHQKSVFD